MNILFGVSNFAGSIGGHLRSLKTILKELSADTNVNIYVVVFGLKPAKSEYDLPAKSLKVICNTQSGFKSMRLMEKDLQEHLKDTPIDVIHAFDSNAFFFLKGFSRKRKLPVILTKCGGPPAPKLKYPVCKNITLFSTEDLVNFQSQQRFKEVKFHMIANRVRTPQQDQSLIEQLRQKYNGGFDFLRVSRFAKLHEHSIRQSIELIKYLRENGIHKRLLLLGGITDQSVYEAIKDSLIEGIYIETGDAFCKEASKVIEIADVVIGTGRGLMEASALGKTLLAPAKNFRLPLLVDEKSFDALFHYNFSGRTNFEPSFESTNAQNILAMTSTMSAGGSNLFSKKMFQEHFDVTNGITKYQHLYKGIQYEPVQDYIGNMTQYAVMLKRFFKK
jgi:hypothetical protein